MGLMMCSKPFTIKPMQAINQIAIDDLDQEAALPNKLVPPEYVTGDLSGLVLRKFSGRKNKQDRNAFIFRGHALGDLALSALAFQNSRAAK